MNLKVQQHFLKALFWIKSNRSKLFVIKFVIQLRKKAKRLLFTSELYEYSHLRIVFCIFHHVSDIVQNISIVLALSL
jgi:hypothetical protein